MPSAHAAVGRGHEQLLLLAVLVAHLHRDRSYLVWRWPSIPGPTRRAVAGSRGRSWLGCPGEQPDSATTMESFYLRSAHLGAARLEQGFGGQHEGWNT